MEARTDRDKHLQSLTARLYGLDTDPTDWKFKNYLSVLFTKNVLAKRRIEALQKADPLWRDYHNITQCLEAIAFNKALIDETL